MAGGTAGSLLPLTKNGAVDGGLNRYVVAPFSRCSDTSKTALDGTRYSDEDIIALFHR